MTSTQAMSGSVKVSHNHMLRACRDWSLEDAERRGIHFAVSRSDFDGKLILRIKTRSLEPFDVAIPFYHASSDGEARRLLDLVALVVVALGGDASPKALAADFDASGREGMGSWVEPSDGVNHIAGQRV